MPLLQQGQPQKHNMLNKGIDGAIYQLPDSKVLCDPTLTVIEKF